MTGNFGDAGGGDESPRVMAVIDVGATSVRMAVAQYDPERGMQHLESLTQAVNLGRDTFTSGSISRESTELCVDALHNFRHVLDEYGVSKPEQIMAVATNAVRDASNRDTFLDRIFIATGIEIRVIDQSEANRFTYLAVQPLLDAKKRLKKQSVMVVEPGGGSTEVLVLKSGKIVFSQAFRLGTLRLTRMVDDLSPNSGSRHQLMRNYIENTVQQIKASLGDLKVDKLVMMGGDMRFAAMQIDPNWKDHQPTGIKLESIRNLAREVIGMNIDELVLKYNLQYPDAETLGPALMTAETLAENLKMNKLLVANPSLRDGLLYELAHEGAWSQEFIDEVCESAIKIGRKYEFDEDHARHTRKLAMRIFDALQDCHRLKAEYRVTLEIAALLHEIGYFISNRSHHKHSMYLIKASDIFGLSSKQKTLIALTARYHRRAAPKSSHPEYEQLRRFERVTVSKLAAMLRVATALDTSRSQRIQNFEIDVDKRSVRIDIPGGIDLSLEQMALRRKGPLFRQVYGRDVVLRSSK